MADLVVLFLSGNEYVNMFREELRNSDFMLFDTPADIPGHSWHQ